jgi:hypothetical protein
MENLLEMIRRLGIKPNRQSPLLLVTPPSSPTPVNPDFTLEKSIEINPIDLTDTFHSFLFIKDIQSSLAVLKLINSKDESNPIIKRGRVGGIIIVFSKSSNKHYLFYRDPSFISSYENAIRFKRLLESNNDEYSDRKFNMYLSYFEDQAIDGIKIFKKIINKETTRYKCINLLEFPNDYVIQYSHNMRLPERITHNPFLNQISSGRTSYYNYIITTRGIIVGEVFDSLENGVVHHLLVDNPNDEVYIGGEIRITDNKLTFNLYSGTYSAPQNTTSNLILTYYLELLLTKLFKLHKPGSRPLDEVKLEHMILLPRKAFNQDEIESFCRRFINRIVKVPEGHRCINNTFGNLTLPIQQQIYTDFVSNKNMLCDNYSGLFVVPAPVAVPVDEKTIFDTIENELKNFGLNKIKLGTYDELKAQFRTLIDDPINFGRFKDGGVVDAYGGKNIEYDRVRPDGKIDRRIFSFKKKLSQGTFNKTEIYIDKTTHDYKEYIFRSSIGTNIDDQFKSFYENLKHIILYVIIRKLLGPNKFIPKPYFFGLKKEANGSVTLYMVMEKGESTLDKYIDEKKIPVDQIKNILFSIYVNLFSLIALFGYKLNFKHNDFKANNIVVTSKGAPLIIDFGFSMFNLVDGGRVLSFVSCEPTQNVVYYLDSNFNIVHDLLQLIASLNFCTRKDFLPFDIFKFVKNSGSNIFDTPVIKSILTSHYGPSSIDDYGLFRNFYKSFNLMTMVQPKLVAITPFVLAENIGFSWENRVTDTYEIKYRKYKEKYLYLKNKI